MKRTFVVLLIIGGATLIYALLAQAPNPPDPDAFYHFAYAKLTRQGLVREFPWMLGQFSGNHWVDHHLLYHLLLVPFTFLPDAIGIRLAAAFFAAALVATSAWALRRIGIRPWWPWVIALVVMSPSFMVRMLLPRAMALGATLMLLVLVALIEKRVRLLFVVCLLFSYTYQASIAVVPIAALWVIATRLDGGGWSMAPLWSAIAGFSVGIVVNPYFPQTIDFLFFHLLYMPARPFARFLSAEWLSDPGIVLVHKLWPHFALTAAAVVATLLRPTGNRRRVVFLFLVACTFLLGVLRATRFIEYFCVVNVMLAAVVFGPALERFTAVRTKAIALGAALSVAGIGSHHILHQKFDALAIDYRADGLARFIRANVPTGTRLTNLRWDIFPMLLAAMPEYRFTVGLEPSFLFYGEPKRSQAWVSLQDGTSRDPAADLATLDSRYVIVTADSTAAVAMLEHNPRFRRLFEEDGTRLYEATPLPTR